MKKYLLVLILAIIAAGQGLAQTNAKAEAEPREFQMKGEDTTYTMRRYVMVLLYSGKRANKIPKSQVAEIQAGHLANITRLSKEGKLLVAGPMGDDTDLRGIFILDCENIEEARALVDTDPAIKAGRLRAEYHPWWTARGTVIQ